MDAITKLQEQLDAAVGEQRRLQRELDAAYVAQHQAVVDKMRAEIERSPDAHALLEWISSHLWDGSAEQTRGALAVLLNDYFVALDKQAGA